MATVSSATNFINNSLTNTDLVIAIDKSSAVTSSGTTRTTTINTTPSLDTGDPCSFCLWTGYHVTTCCITALRCPQKVGGRMAASNKTIPSRRPFYQPRLLKRPTGSPLPSTLHTIRSRVKAADQLPATKNWVKGAHRCFSPNLEQSSGRGGIFTSHPARKESDNQEKRGTNRRNSVRVPASKPRLTGRTPLV